MATKAKKAKTKTSLITITYRCVSGTCEPDQDPVSLNKGDQVYLAAGTSDVEIKFDLASPFQSGDGYPASNSIKITKNTTLPETIGNVTATFSYRCKCSNPRCASASNNPEMIVQ
jgi:hypothetical protein